jgi:hypothetical protein
MLDKEAEKLREGSKRNIINQTINDNSENVSDISGPTTNRLDSFRAELARREAELIEKKAHREAMQQYLDKKVDEEIISVGSNSDKNEI